jgi:hypothetical protein
MLYGLCYPVFINNSLHLYHTRFTMIADRETLHQRHDDENLLLVAKPSVEPKRGHPEEKDAQKEEGQEENGVKNESAMEKEIDDVQMPAEEMTPLNSIFNFDVDELSAVLEVVDSDSWSDDEVFSSSMTAAAVQDSFRAIRDEAKRMESILANDKLDSINEELQAARRQISIREAELEEQRDVVKLKENRIAMLELERDLYKADNQKLKQDLTNLVSQSPQTCAMLSSPMEDCGLVASPMVKLLGVDMYSSPSNEDDDHVLLVPSNLERSNEPARVQRKYHNVQGRRDAFLPQRRTYITPSRAARICPQPTCSDAVPVLSNNRNVVSVDMQIQNLHRRLQNSMDVCEELRKRLAMLGRYYENMVRRLQDRLAMVTVDKEKIEISMVAQLSSMNIDKRRKVRLLEAKLAEKEAAIDLLRATRKRSSSKR